MTTATDLLIEYAKTHHPLGRSLALEDAPNLVEQLRLRLNTTHDILDMSPASLKRLEYELVQFYQLLNQSGRVFTDEELAEFIREIAAYLGLVLVKHAEARWKVLATDSLWATYVSFGEYMDLTKGVKPFVSPFPLSMSLGNYAAASWDLIALGKDPGLYKMYQTAKRKLSSQRR